MTTQNIPVVTGDVVDSDVNANAKIAATKLVHRHAKEYGQDGGADVASATRVLHTARAKGTVGTVEVTPDTAPTGGDKQFTVDLEKSTGGGAWTSVLSAAVTIDNTATDRTLVAGVISSAAYSDGDAFRVNVTASGSTGSQGQGFAVTVNFDEEPS